MHLLKSILTFLLIPLMLVSTTGVKISQHWCGDVLINANIWGEAEPCEHFNSDSVCPNHQTTVKKKNCCDQRETLVQSGDDTLENIHFSISALKSFIHLPFENDSEQNQKFTTLLNPQIRIKAPPLGGPAIFLAIQSLLI